MDNRLNEQRDRGEKPKNCVMNCRKGVLFLHIDLQNMFACECCSQWMKHVQKWFYAAGPIIVLLRW